MRFDSIQPLERFTMQFTILQPCMNLRYVCIVQLFLLQLGLLLCFHGRLMAKFMLWINAQISCPITFWPSLVKPRLINSLRTLSFERILLKMIIIIIYPLFGTVQTMVSSVRTICGETCEFPLERGLH